MTLLGKEIKAIDLFKFHTLVNELEKILYPGFFLVKVLSYLPFEPALGTRD